MSIFNRTAKSETKSNIKAEFRSGLLAFVLVFAGLSISMIGASIHGGIGSIITVVGIALTSFALLFVNPY